MLDPVAAEALLSGPVVVEEKLDGANVMIWIAASGAIDAATRGGPGAIDRAGQLGPLRAWIARHHTELRRVLTAGAVLYGEWLWFEHGVPYDRLPDHLVALDVLACERRWLDVDERNTLVHAVSLETPPEIARGRIDDVGQLRSLLGSSRYGSQQAEGLVVRPLTAAEGVPRVAKLVRAGFASRSDERWAAGARRQPPARP